MSYAMSVMVVVKDQQMEPDAGNVKETEQYLNLKMMIKEVKMFAADCDRCGQQWHYDIIYAYTDKSDVEEMIANSDGIIQEDGKTYCFNCYTIGDNDEVVILPLKQPKDDE